MEAFFQDQKQKQPVAYYLNYSDDENYATQKPRNAIFGSQLRAVPVETTSYIMDQIGMYPIDFNAKYAFRYPASDELRIVQQANFVAAFNRPSLRYLLRTPFIDGRLM
jgi:hypothetical protein